MFRVLSFTSKLIMKKEQSSMNTWSCWCEWKMFSEYVVIILSSFRREKITSRWPFNICWWLLYANCEKAIIYFKLISFYFIADAHFFKYFQRHLQNNYMRVYLDFISILLLIKLNKFCCHLWWRRDIFFIIFIIIYADYII